MSTGSEGTGTNQKEEQIREEEELKSDKKIKMQKKKRN